LGRRPVKLQQGVNRCIGNGSATWLVEESPIKTSKYVTKEDNVGLEGIKSGKVLRYCKSI